MERRSRIVLLIDWFIPAYKAGGPIQSCANFAFAMSKKYDIYIITGDTDLGESKAYITESNVWTNSISPHIHVYYFSKDKLTYTSLRKTINEVEPDFIYLNHIFSPFYVLVPLWMWWWRHVKSKMVVCPRGALFDSALHHKNTYFKKIVVLTLIRILNIYKNVRFHATNEGEKKAIQKYFPTDKITTINNLSSSRQFPLKSISKIDNDLKLMFIARIVPIKNLLLVLEALTTVSANVTFTIVGPLEDKEYWEICQRKINGLPTNIRANYLGPKSSDELRLILEEHHLYILPTKGENFGHTIIEALLVGRPVLISDNTPWRNLTAQQIGWDISLQDQNRFAQIIEEVAAWQQKDFDEWSARAWNFAANFIAQSEEVRKYEQLFS